MNRKKKATKKTKSPPQTSEEIKTTILRCARQAFAQHGYQGANLKDIAHNAGVAGSLINYHFHDKATLFKVCLEFFALKRVETINRILQAEPKSVEELKVRISLFVEEMLLSYTEDADSFNIVRTEVRAENPVVMELFQTTFLQCFINVCDLFDKAKKNGVISKNLDVMITAKLLFTLACESTQNDHIGKRYFNVTVYDDVWRKKLAEHIVEVFMNGVTK